jgi:hypothetical protein
MIDGDGSILFERTLMLLLVYCVGLTILYCLSLLSAWAFHRSHLRPTSIVWSALTGSLAALPPIFWGQWGFFLLACVWPFLGLLLFMPASRLLNRRAVPDRPA